MRAAWRFIRGGIDPTRLRATLRLAVASWLALLLAWQLGMAHPQWAAMTVWIVGQPSRGQMLEKALSRVLGTAIGALVGCALLLWAGPWPPLLVLGIALWVAACAGLGNLWRGSVSYATILAGYTAAMIALIPFDQPATVLPLALDRVLEIGLGVAVSLLANWFFVRALPPSGLDEALRALERQVREHLGRADATATGPGTDGTALIAVIAALDERLEAFAQGSLSARRRVTQARHRLADWTEAVLTPPSPALPHARRLALHRDTVQAARAAVRAACALLLVGTVWLATGWAHGPYLVLGTAVMLSLFSTMDNPPAVMRHIAAGAVAGAASAAAFQLWVMPWAGQLTGGLSGVLVATLPVLLAGGVVLAHRRSAMAGMDFNLGFLLLLHPAWPVSVEAASMASAAFAVALPPLLALLAYRFALPVDAERRIDSAERASARELRALARRAPAGHRAARQAAAWRARQLHRLLRRAHLAGRGGDTQALSRSVHQARTALDLGETILRMHRHLGDPALPRGVARALRATLRTLAHPKRSEARHARMLRRAAGRLAGIGHAGAHTLERLAARVEGHAALSRAPAASS